jgi:dissimilatory sulfite reductase (desulfoviridin) alpha/beta subunit
LTHLTIAPFFSIPAFDKSFAGLSVQIRTVPTRKHVKERTGYFVLEKASETLFQKVFKQTGHNVRTAGDLLTARKIAEILEILGDGQWHMLEEIQQKMRLNNSQIQQIVAFLKEYDFVTIDDVKKEMKLEKAVRKLLS